MSFKEYDFDNPAHRRRRPPQILEGEVLSSSVVEPQPQPIRFDRRRNVRVPRWAVALLAVGVLAVMFPFALVVSIVIIAILALMYPTVALIAVAWLVACVSLIVWDRRRRGVTVSSNNPAI
jgi:hypothetical protein